MKTLGLKISILLLFHISAFGQVEEKAYLEGKISRNNQEGIEYAGIIVADTINDKIFTAISDKGGHFFIDNIPNGTYRLRISYIGYEIFEKIINIENALDLKTILLLPESVVLDEVTVTASLPSIKYDLNKYVVEIENSMAATGKTVEELLLMCPGVWASADGNISINGIKGATVMIDNKPVNLSGEVLLDYLHSFRSENISKIEIRPLPPSEMDAGGLGGIINIVSKKNKEAGWKSNLGTTINKQKFAGISPFASFEYTQNKWGLQFFASGETSKWLLYTDHNTEHHTDNRSFLSSTVDTVYDSNLSLTLNSYYDINDKQKVGLKIYHLFWNKEEKMENRTDMKINEILDTKLYSLHPENQNMKIASYSFNYNYDIDSLGRNLTFWGDYNQQYKYDVSDRFHYITFDKDGQIILDEQEKNLVQKPYSVYSAKVDYNHPIDKTLSFKAGLKYSYSEINDKQQYDSLSTDGTWNFYNERCYDFKYHEQLLAGYIQSEKQIHKTVVNIGLRSEYSQYKFIGNSKWNGYWKLFPSLFIKQEINDNNSFNVSYVKRIQRIGYFKLIPNHYYSNKYEVMEGNPELKPEIIHVGQAGYLYRNKYSLTLSYSVNKNKLSRYIGSDPSNGIMIDSYVDGGKENSFSANIFVPVTLFKWWETTNQITYFHERYSHLNQKLYQNSMDLFTQHYFKLPLKIQGEILYRYNSPSQSGYTYYSPYHLINIACQRKFLNDRLLVKLEAQKLLWNQRSEYNTSSENMFKSISFYSPPFPFVNLSFSYCFSAGKNKPLKGIDSGNREEIQRTY
jgi:hypothetical protein